MEYKKLEQFYDAWSCKSPVEIAREIAAATRKADEIANELPHHLTKNINSLLDFGCGYGAVLYRLRERFNITGKAIGVDYSQGAIDVAIREFEGECGKLNYHTLPSLDASANAAFISTLVGEKVDCILLIDLLEHVPDCKTLVAELARYTNYFIIKLPVESTVFDNYVLPKEYPSPAHSNGHLREFDANNVYYFIRQLGLTPLYEKLYIYSAYDTNTPPRSGASFRQRLLHGAIVFLRIAASKILPKKIFLRWVGGGGYFCLATFEASHILNP